MTEFEIACQLSELMDFVTKLTKKYLHEHRLSSDEQKMLYRLFTLFNYDIRCSSISEKIEQIVSSLKK